MPSKRLTRSKPRRVEDFMALCRPYTASKVARAINTLTPGIDWMKCSKGHMAQEWAFQRSSHARDFADVELDDIDQSLRFDAALLWEQWRDFVWRNMLPNDATIEQKTARRAAFEKFMVETYPGISPKYILYVLRSSF